MINQIGSLGRVKLNIKQRNIKENRNTSLGRETIGSIYLFFFLYFFWGLSSTWAKKQALRATEQSCYNCHELDVHCLDHISGLHHALPNQINPNAPCFWTFFSSSQKMKPIFFFVNYVAQLYSVFNVFLLSTLHSNCVVNSKKRYSWHLLYPNFTFDFPVPKRTVFVVVACSCHLILF